MNVFVGFDSRDFSEIQPLRGEIVHEGIRARIGEHASNLLLDHCRILQLPAGGQADQLGVRNTAPQEKRYARRKLQIGEPKRRSRNSGWLTFDSEQKTRRRQNALQPSLNAHLESASRAAAPVEAQQRLDILFCHGTPIRLGRQAGQNLCGAGLLARAIFRTARKYLAATGRVGRFCVTRQVVRTTDQHAFDRRAVEIILVRDDGITGLTRTVDAFALPILAHETTRRLSACRPSPAPAPRDAHPRYACTLPRLDLPGCCRHNFPARSFPCLHRPLKIS